MAGEDVAFVRQGFLEPTPPPSRLVGPIAWARQNLFSSPFNSIATVVAILFVFWVIWSSLDWLIFNATFEGDSREACLRSVDGAPLGACWAFVKAKFGQFIYGRYPVDERWRVDIVFALFAALLIPMAIPRAPYKRENALALLVIFPVVALVLLTGGDFDFSPSTNFLLVCVLGAVVVFSLLTSGMAETGNRVFRGAVIVVAIGVAAGIAATLLSLTPIAGDYSILAGIRFGGRPTPLGPLVLGVTGTLAIALSVLSLVTNRLDSGARKVSVGAVFAPAIGLILIYAVLSFDFGLQPVETPLWGGLLVTLVVAVTGIVASLPLGILLALGRRSKLPVIRWASVAFVELWRGVPLITVLFMASVMLPLFLPSGVNFDKLMRALIGVALFSAAYMAEVIRGGLQAVPKGQYEAAAAVGLGYWQAMRLIVLPQALKIVIPGIVNSFISLFKDTSLVLIIGIFDLLGIIQQNFADPNWASPVTPATGFIFAACIYWVFCFSMSRYSQFMERRLNTGHKR
ncbi:MAG: amino acid ABC transporter permease [Hyphomicrobium sp.]|nr:amino acid ABC transporter permease [Hyphomicrobium sp.]